MSGVIGTVIGMVLGFASGFVLGFALGGDVATYPKARTMTRFHNADERTDDDLEAYALEKMKRELGV